MSQISATQTDTVDRHTIPPQEIRGPITPLFVLLLHPKQRPYILIYTGDHFFFTGDHFILESIAARIRPYIPPYNSGLQTDDLFNKFEVTPPSSVLQSTIQPYDSRIHPRAVGRRQRSINSTKIP